MVRTERADEVDLLGSGDARDLGAHGLRDLDGERADVSGRPTDQDPGAGPERPAAPIAKALERKNRRVRQRRGGLEVQTVRDRQEGLLGRADQLGEGTLAGREQVGVDAIAGAEPGDVPSDRLDDAGNVRAEPNVPRSAQAEE
jgi:hypothetical protein